LTYKPTASLDDSDTYTFTLPGVRSRKDGAIALDDFRAYLEAKINRWNEQLGFNNDDVGHCEVNYTSAADDNLGFGAFEFRSDLYSVCDVEQPGMTSI